MAWSTPAFAGRTACKAAVQQITQIPCPGWARSARYRRPQSRCPRCLAALPRPKACRSAAARRWGSPRCAPCPEAAPAWPYAVGWGGRAGRGELAQSSPRVRCWHHACHTWLRWRQPSRRGLRSHSNPLLVQAPHFSSAMMAAKSGRASGSCRWAAGRAGEEPQQCPPGCMQARQRG